PLRNVRRSRGRPVDLLNLHPPPPTSTNLFTSAVVRSAAPRPSRTTRFPAPPALARAPGSCCHPTPCECGWCRRRALNATAPPRPTRGVAPRLLPPRAPPAPAPPTT